ncbi:putative PurR-regulated permease PerM [Mariprofundus ferrinatatus]|uniref:Putative PurR-regulated permease PerM n=1 Tax=Mariprofundus ferrinatatus TaxID=1921087 RepID=A0A2K8L1Y5_9PROT|nr:AI-2E family transporter [Mariprofundus ferrinatatus]ATX81102.1 putative PurR-regulated permease PerM [Mariprofundus ferrinatatus]
MDSRSGMNILVPAAAFVVIVAGMQAATSMLVPFLLAAFIAIICLPPLKWLTSKGFSPALSVLSITLVLVLLGSLLGAFVGASVAEFTNNLPIYQARLNQQTSDLITWLAGFGISLDTQLLRDNLDPSIAMGMAGKLLSGLGNVLANTFLIVLTVIFLLIEITALPHKWSAMGEHAPSTGGFERFVGTVSSYFAIKTWISLATGTLIAIWLTFVGVDHALLWGLVAFLFNFVPNIGSIIAAVPAVLLALVQLGLGDALLAGLGFVAVNIVMGNAVEPRYMGKGVGLSTLVVFLSLVFWGWVLGPVGMLLSVPLTMIVKLALEAREDTQWLAILIGPDIEARDS